MKRGFWRTANGGRYHRDRQCAYLRHAVQFNLERRFEANDPGAGVPLYEPYALTACSRCGV